MVERPSNQSKHIGRRTAIQALALITASLAFKHRERKNTTSRKNADPHVRINIITDVHIANTNAPTQANLDAPNALRSVVNTWPKSDITVDIGDMITERRSDIELNIENETKGFELLKSSSEIVRHVPGNHDKWGIPDKELKAIYRRFGQEELHWVQQFKDIQLVGIDIFAPVGKHAVDREIAWLEQVVYTDTPTIIFSHYPLYQPNMMGNTYFKKDPKSAWLQNGADVWRAIQHFPIWAVVSGHTHSYLYRLVDNTHMIIADSFTETPDGKHHGAYSTLDIQGKSLIFTRLKDGMVKERISLPVLNR